MTVTNKESFMCDQKKKSRVEQNEIEKYKHEQNEVILWWFLTHSLLYLLLYIICTLTLKKYNIQGVMVLVCLRMSYMHEL